VHALALALKHRPNVSSSSARKVFGGTTRPPWEVFTQSKQNVADIYEHARHRLPRLEPLLTFQTKGSSVFCLEESELRSIFFSASRDVIIF